MSPAPVIGAAVVLESLERLRNWAFERDRDLELQDFFMPEVLDGDWTALTDRYRDLLAGHRGRIGVHGPFWGFTIDTHDPDVAAVVRKRLGQGLDVCAAVGATQMVMHSPFTTWDAHNLDAYAGARDAMIERVHRVIGPIVKRAENEGVELVIENIEDKDPMERRRLAESFDSPAVKLSIDTGHAHYAHGATGAPPVDYFVTSAGSMLAHVHLQDADGWADRHWPIGDGTIRWPAVFDALARIEARPRLLLELMNHDRIVDSAARLEALGVAQ
jgi:sugar phosphate isomerase/epimerase